MADAHGHDVEHHVKIYMRVFVALLVLTVVTVGVSYVDLGFTGNVALALFIALVKGGLVACYFMHLVSEEKYIYYTLIMTVLFFFVLLFTPTLWHGDPISL